VTGPGASAPGWRWLAAAAASYALATVVLTWPLLRDPASTVLDAASLYGGAEFLVQRDVNLTMWALAWDSHALVTDPLGLFHANVFHPAPWSLACSEHMLGNAPLFAPVYLASGNPVLAHQATLLLTFVLSGLAMAVWALYWTGDRAAAAAAGFLYAFAPFRFWQLGNVHVISIQYLPLVMLGIDATLDRRGGRAAAAVLAVAVVLSSLCSYYVGYAAFVLAGAYLAVGLLVRGRAHRGRALVAGGALAAAAVVVAALTVPYLLLQQRGIIPDYRHKSFLSLAFLGLVIQGPLTLLGRYVLPVRQGIPQFLGWTVVALALLGIAGRRGHPRGALLAVALAGALLGLGPLVLTPWTSGPVSLPYRWLAEVVPGFSALRVPQRFGALVTLAAVSLAALGIAWARARLRTRGLRLPAAALPWLAVAAALVEATPRGLRPVAMEVGSRVPAAYRWLAEHGAGGALLELPARADEPYQESVFMYYSTFHWLPTVNGYTAYPPRSYRQIMRAARALPAPEALRSVLALAPVRWVLLHRALLPPESRAAWEAALAGALVPVAEFGEDVLFEVPRRGAG
jgi:hypothetical protein